MGLHIYVSLSRIIQLWKPSEQTLKATDWKACEKKVWIFPWGKARCGRKWKRHEDFWKTIPCKFSCYAANILETSSRSYTFFSHQKETKHRKKKKQRKSTSARQTSSHSLLLKTALLHFNIHVKIFTSSLFNPKGQEYWRVLVFCFHFTLMLLVLIYSAFTTQLFRSL